MRLPGTAQRPDFGHRYAVRLNKAVCMIDAAPFAPWTLAMAASHACMSPFHFHRVFKNIVGESVRDYVERRRIGHAFIDRRNGNHWKASILNSGFASQISFTRAFKRVYGVTPSQWEADESAEGSGKDLVSDPPEGIEFVDRPSSRLAISRVWGGEGNPAHMRAGIARLIAWAQANGLDTSEGKLFGMTLDDPALAPITRRRHDFALEIPDGVVPGDGLLPGQRGAGKWATRRVTGTVETIHAAWHQFYHRWLPQKGSKLRYAPVEEAYLAWSDKGDSIFDVLCCAPIISPNELSMTPDGPVIAGN